MATQEPTIGGASLCDVPMAARAGAIMSEEEFIAWCDEDTRAEWVDGEVVMMSPVSDEHDDVNGWLYSLLRLYVEHHDMGVLKGPEFQVRFAGQRRRRVPDLLFVANSRRDIVRRTHIEGAPDAVIEIVSPESQARDWREKYLDYQTAGVREYWIIDPMSEQVEVYALADAGEYRRIDQQEGVIRSTAIPGFFVRVSWLWRSTRPKVLMALRELGVVSGTDVQDSSSQ